MSETVEAEGISRRKALGMLGLAVAFGMGTPAVVLTASDAEAQTQGTEQRSDRTEPRQERRTGRTERRQERRTARAERREMRREGRAERRGMRRTGTTGQAPAKQ